MSTPDLHFESDQFTSKTPSPPTTSTFTTPTFTKPTDDFTAPPVLPNTLFYLAIIRPHKDEYKILGPVTKFIHLLEPEIMAALQFVPNGLDKIEKLRYIEDAWGEREEVAEFTERGFTTLVAKGQRDIYTVLKILRQVSKPVFQALPSPVYIVSAHGPLTYSSTPSLYSGPGNRGYAAGTTLIGSFASRSGAKAAAEDAMAKMVQGVGGVKVEAHWQEGGKGGGMVIGMVPGRSWEVRVKYEDEVYKRVLEDEEREGRRERGLRT